MGAPEFLIDGADSRHSYVSKNWYVKTKESGPLGGRHILAVPPRIHQWYWTHPLKKGQENRQHLIRNY